MTKLSVVDLDNILNTSLGPGALFEDLIDDSVSGLTKAMQGNTAYGRKLGSMTSTPEPTIAREWIDLTENLVGIHSTLKGAKQVQRVDVELAVELAEEDFANYKMLNPGQVETAWLNSVHASLITGTANASFELLAKAEGVAGNSITRIVTDPGPTANAPLTVSVSGNAITVAVATDTGGVEISTAKQVVDAINAHPGASALVRAGLPSTSNGSGVVVAAVSAPLAGGTAGTRIGSEFQDQGYITESNYKNLSFLMESQRSRFNSVLTLFSCLQTGDYNPSRDDEGNIAGIGATFTAHGDLNSYDAATGTILPPYKYRQLDKVLS